MVFSVLSIVGARPQFVKAAAVSRAMNSSKLLREKIIHTGQHFDDNMSAVFFRELNIPEPSFHLNLHGGNHGEMTGRMLEAIEKVLIAERPNIVVIYGDTNSTLAGALAAAKLHIPIAHVEAGLRSFNRAMPEEVNRVVADHLSSLLLCPTIESVANLGNEALTRGVHHVGDVMFDATLFAREVAMRESEVLNRLELEPGKYAVCTLHRAENTDDVARLRRLVAYLENKAHDQIIVFPVHPRTRRALARTGIDIERLMLVDPLGYIDLNRLLASATEVFTDSGGLQKEAYFHSISCTTLRQETEWVETVANGWNRLWDGPGYVTPRRAITEYGNGNAAGNVVTKIEDYLTAKTRV